MPSFQLSHKRRRHAPRVARSWVGSALSLLGALFVVGTAVGQVQLPEGRGVIQGPEDVTWQVLLESPYSCSYQAVQQRTMDDGQGGLVTLRESLTVEGKGGSDSPFRLSFEAVVGQAPTAPVRQWSAVYDTHAGLVYRHGAFAVRDAKQARKNYRLISFGDATRAGRPAWRVIVFPRRLDKGIWVVDLDRQTGVPLYRAEYSVHGKLISELEVTTFALVNPGAALRNSWKPSLEISNLNKLNQVASRLSSVPVEPQVDGIMGEYEQHMMHMTEDPLNGDKSLVIGYTDGVDEFFILQEFGRINPIPIVRSHDAGEAHTIASYNDPHMRVYVFHVAGVTYKVVGRSSLMRLQDVARDFCHQVATTR